MEQPIVDRTYEHNKPDVLIIVTLECGYGERFFIPGLTDTEYISRTRELKRRSIEAENKQLR